MKDVIIIAKGESRRLCPFDAQEVWGVKDVCTFKDFLDKKFHRVFDFEPRPVAYMDKLKGHASEGVKITSWQDYGEIKYPLKEVIEKFGSMYFTNTLSYMIALAIYEGFEHIRLYGCDAPFGGVYFIEKSGIEYWIGRGQSLGVKFTISEGSHVLRTKTGQIYGMKENEGRVLLYLQERLVLMNMMPMVGTHDECFISNMARNILAVKEPEGKQHNITINYNQQGQLGYKCDHEFATELWMPDYVWDYIRNRLITFEKSGKLPLLALSMYEKLVSFGDSEADILKRHQHTESHINISYVLTTKDRPPYLTKAFENIRKLLKPNDELIVVDGSEQDDTALIKANMDIISCLIKEKDKGPNDAFNKGALVAKGKYVKWLCDDDIVFPEPMAQATAYMDAKPEIDLLVCSGTKKDGRGDIVTFVPPSYGNSPKDVLKYGACGIGFVIRRTSLSKMGLLDPHHMIPDQEFALRAMSLGCKVAGAPLKVYYHPIYQHSTSIRDRKEWGRQQGKLIKQHISLSYCYQYKYFVQPLNRLMVRVSKWLNK